MLELEAQAPEKFDRDDLEFEIKVTKSNKDNSKNGSYMDPGSWEYRMLMSTLLEEYFNRKNEDLVEEPVEKSYIEYETYSLEQTQEILKEYFERKESRKIEKALRKKD